MSFKDRFSGTSSHIEHVTAERVSTPWTRGPATRGLRMKPRRDPVPVSSAPFGDLIDFIDILTISARDDNPHIENAQYVASYNWLDEGRASILVPGAPPAWTPPEKDVKLKQDEGTYFRDLNASRYPRFPTEPAIRALYMMQRSYEVDNIHIFTCHKTMEHLLKFVESDAKPFRMDADKVGNTIFLVRKERSPFETIEGITGYGHTFPDAYTTWDLPAQNSISHQRVVSYRFGGLNCLVCSGTDCYERLPGATYAADGSNNTVQEKRATNDTDSISTDTALSALEVSSKDPAVDKNLHIGIGGDKVDQSQVFDIKTRNRWRVCDIDEFMPRLWLTQTPRLLLAYHKSGVFERPCIEDCQDNIREWEKKKAVVIGKFLSLLQRLVNIMSNETDPRAEVSWDGEGPLKITKQIGHERRVLPDDLLRKWAEGSRA